MFASSAGGVVLFQTKFMPEFLVGAQVIKGSPVIAIGVAHATETCCRPMTWETESGAHLHDVTFDPTTDGFERHTDT